MLDSPIILDDNQLNLFGSEKEDDCHVPHDAYTDNDNH